MIKLFHQYNFFEDASLFEEWNLNNSSQRRLIFGADSEIEEPKVLTIEHDYVHACYKDGSTLSFNELIRQH